MQQNFYIPGTGLYEGEPYSYLWPFSQALAATVSVSNIPGQAAIAASTYSRELKVRLFGLQNYWSPTPPADQPSRANSPKRKKPAKAPNPPKPRAIAPPALPSFNGEVVPPGGASYYDDNEWVGIELVRLYELTPRSACARKGRADHGVRDGRLADDQSERSLPVPAACRSQMLANNTERNTVTDGPGAELGAAALPADRQRRISAVREDGLRMGAQLPAARQTACMPTTSARTGDRRTSSGATTRAR